MGTIDFYFPKVLNYFDYFFTCVFTLEILIKVIHFLYFRQPRYFVINRNAILSHAFFSHAMLSHVNDADHVKIWVLHVMQV